MAGLGRKVFTAGDVLTASDLQSYAVDQSVMVFAGTAARSSAIATPTEGMVSVVTDTDELQYYNGTSWTSGLPFGAWQSYTPVWSGNNTPPAIVGGTITGNYAQIGKTVHVRIAMTLAATSTIGTSSRYTWTLPVTGKANGSTLGNGSFYKVSTTTYYIAPALRLSTTLIDAAFAALSTTVTGTVFSATTPVVPVPASLDQYAFNFTYEAA